MEKGKKQMKRKILVLLLAMTLALSLMPILAFADNEIEDPKTVSKVAEEDKAQSALEAKNATRLWGPKPCAHNSVFFEYYYDEDNEDEYPRTPHETYHEVKGEGIIKQTRCKECFELLDEETLGYTTITERHFYDDDDECWICHHKNTCPHPEPYYYYYDYYDCEDATITDRGDFHEVDGWIDRETYCKECGAYLNEEEVFVKTKVSLPHFFNSGGACEECGHLNDETRLYGSSRYDTAITVANRYKKNSESEKFKNVIVAYGENYPDALSGGYLANAMHAPILLVHPSVEDYIVEYIAQNIESRGKVYILGGTGVVRQEFANKISAKGIEPIRLGGKTRYDTNLKILEEARKEAGTDSKEILICTGENYADSLSASATGKPILLVENTLSDAQKEYIQSLSTEKFYLIGGEGAVVPKIKADLISLEISEDNIDRLWGQTRYETSTEVANQFFNKPQTVVLAYAQNFPDGLSGGPFATQKGAPIILTDSTKTEAARTYVKSAGATSNFTLGGPSLISDYAVESILGN